MPERTIRSRLHRDSVLAQLELQPRDLVVLRDLFHYRIASTPALMRTAAWASGGQGMQAFAKRLTLLFRAGFVSRWDAGTSRYLHGSRPLLYAIESGKAAGAARTGLRPEHIDDETWRTILRDAAPVRARVREALLNCGFELPEIDRVIHNTTELLFKHYVGDPCGVRHRVLAAECLSRVWYEARMAGHPVENIQPDGADLSFREPEPRRYRELVNAAGVIVIKPDCLFTIEGKQYALEAETGSHSLPAVTWKLRRYARLIELRARTVQPLHLIVYSGTGVHKGLVDAAIRMARIDARYVSSLSEEAAAAVGFHRNLR